MLYVERQAYLKAIRAVIGGLEEARVTLAKVRQRLEEAETGRQSAMKSPGGALREPPGTNGLSNSPQGEARSYQRTEVASRGQTAMRRTASASGIASWRLGKRCGHAKRAGSCSDVRARGHYRGRSELREAPCADATPLSPGL